MEILIANAGLRTVWGIVLKQRKEKQIQLARAESLQTGVMEWNREMESTEGVTEPVLERQKMTGILNIACPAH